MRTQQGFTIVELVVVIVVIGILAAVALPRFLGLSDRAHDAVVEGTQAALASGVVMAKSVWLAQGRDSALDDILEKKIGKTCVGAATLSACGGTTASKVPTDPGPDVGLDANRNGYPMSHTAYNATATTTPVANNHATEAGGAEACTEVFEFLMSESSVKATNKVPSLETPAIDPADFDFEFVASATIGNGSDTYGTCSYTYQPDKADNQNGNSRVITYDTTTGRVTVTGLSSVGETST